MPIVLSFFYLYGLIKKEKLLKFVGLYCLYETKNQQETTNSTGRVDHLFKTKGVIFIKGMFHRDSSIHLCPSPNFYVTKAFQKLGEGRELFGIRCEPVYEIDPRRLLQRQPILLIWNVTFDFLLFSTSNEISNKKVTDFSPTQTLNFQNKIGN